MNATPAPAPYVHGPAAAQWQAGFSAARQAVAASSWSEACALRLREKETLRTPAYWAGWRAYLANEGGVYGRDALEATVAEALV